MAKYSGFILLTSMLTAIIGVAAENSPVVNVRTASMQQVSGYKSHNQYLDLSSCSFDGSEFDVTVTEHDSLYSVVFPERRYDFIVRNDTVLMLCEETRDMKFTFPFGLAVDFIGTSAHRSDEIQVSGRYRQNLNLCGEIGASVDFPETATLITAEGDTVTDIRSDHFTRSMRYAVVIDSTQTISTTPDSLIINSVTDTRLYTGTDEEFPRVIQRKTIITGNFGSIADSTTYILRSTPEKITAARQKARPQNNNNYARTSDGSSILLSSDGESVIVMPSDASSELSLVINDVAGRVFLSEKISKRDQCDIDITFLPKGEYLIQLLCDGQISAVIKLIKQL